mgnify:CR=1 FL=1
MKIIQNITVGPSLGQDSIDKGILSTIIGMLLVFVFMVIYYRMSGTVACFALVLNLVLLLGAMAVFDATLTLPGIAGIVLTVGIAVDSNVLIYERIREEVRAGRSPINAIDAGFARALATILDSNITTFIAAAVLFYIGSGPVRGFALTLMLGIFCDIVMMLLIKRPLIILLSEGPMTKAGRAATTFLVTAVIVALVGSVA